ncbi:DEAD/DEAH box helicase [Flavisolibacter tropicus]|uniref:DEAD/DEAH box helicase n=1 Tax=Flavisolibacter tropicus TaxID=1492898 RepID=UPI000A62DB39|nr:DEAD/DEAH box helicase [Flavisolibacter tropicus]
MHKRHYSIETILSNLNIENLNEMQEASIEATKKHDNVMILSATGSGKTLAFLLPVLQHIDGHNKNTQAIVIVPSRELALQIEQVFRTMGTGLKVTCCYGGHKREIEENNLIQPPAVIIGTPGRLADHIRRGNITVDSIETVVLDEFDKSLELGFQEEVATVISAFKNIKRRILTSATQAVEVPDFVGQLHLNNWIFCLQMQHLKQPYLFSTLFLTIRIRLTPCSSCYASSGVVQLLFSAITGSRWKECISY